MIISIEGAHKSSQKYHLHWGGLETPKKSITIIEQIACQNWSSSLRLLKNQKKSIIIIERNACQKWSSSSRSLINQKKSIIIIKQNACQKWSKSWRGLQNPQKKVSSSWSAMHAKNDRDYSGGFETQKKSIISIIQILRQKWSFSSRGLKKTSKTDHNPKKSIIMTEKISCHCMSKMIIIIEGAQKHLKTP